ncbi:MAG: (d)CMP kinase [Pseudomonadota bacterium]
MTFVVAIDGPAAAGKGTIARALAEKFGLGHLDTGLLYRAVGKKALAQGRGVLDEGVAELVAQELMPEDLAVDGLRTVMVTRASSKVAAMPGVRKALVDFQRAFAERDGGAVLDGRDIGTVICPDAPVKLFVTADAETRAERRHAELAASGSTITIETVLADLRARDERDSERADAPMLHAEDAHLLDTSELDIDAAVIEASKIVEQALSRRRG